MDTTKAGTYGWMWQRIAAVGRVAATRTKAHALTRTARADAHLRSLLRNGRITNEQLHRAVEAYQASPSDFAWLANMDQPTLARADCVFLAQHGHLPLDGDAFRLNGTYHRICRSLLYNWHYYDDWLEKLYYDEAGRSYIRSPDVQVRQEVQTGEIAKGNRRAFWAVLATGLIGGLAIEAAILRGATTYAVPALWVFGVIWLLCSAAAVAVTVPRRIPYRRTIFRCGRCAREFDQQQAMIGCPGCGALFKM